MPGGIPSDCRIQCTDHPEFEAASWTDTYNHIKDEHEFVSPLWKFLATGVTTP